MSESNPFNEFFTGWFSMLEKGLEKLNEQECACLFSECGKTCSWYVVNYVYRKLFDECEGNLDRFFSRIHEIESVDGKVVFPGQKVEYQLTTTPKLPGQLAGGEAQPRGVLKPNA